MSRPPIAIGHVTLHVRNIVSATSFYKTLGLRVVIERNELAILELRGGTHLMLFRAKRRPKPGPIKSFDFMVDDLDAVRSTLLGTSVVPSEISSDRLSGHRLFSVRDPDGYVLTIYSSHTNGREV